MAVFDPRRLVKNIGVEAKIFGLRVVITDESIGISQLFGGMCPSFPQSLLLCLLRLVTFPWTYLPQHDVVYCS